jgi:NitT/TauT family transport system substrate-binding protein
MRSAIIGLLALAVAMLAASGCGDESASGEAGRPTKLTVGLVPIADAAPIQLGIEKGFFAQEGLDVEVRTAQGGAEIVAQAISGDVQVGFSNTPSLLQAASEGVPVEIVAPAAGSPPRSRRGEDIEGAAMVRRDSPIRSYADLAGKTVAVNALGALADLGLNAALGRHGVDRGDVERLEVPFPDMLPALDAGRVDVALLATPFKTMAEQAGDYRAIGYPIHELRPELIYLGYFVSREWAEENEEVLGRFLSALRRTMLYAAGHERQTRRAVGELTDLPRELLPALPKLNRRPDCSELTDSSALLARLMVKYGALEQEPDLEELIRPGFCDG